MNLPHLTLLLLFNLGANIDQHCDTEVALTAHASRFMSLLFFLSLIFLQIIWFFFSNFWFRFGMREEKRNKLLILYASQTGNALDAAECIGRESERRGCPVVVRPVDDYDAVSQFFVSRNFNFCLFF